MDRLIATNSVPAALADTAPATGTPQFATSGNPATSTPATVLPAYAFNALQEELIAIITAAGITADRTNNAQVLAAIRALIKQSSILMDSGTANAYVAVNPTPLTSATLLNGTRQTVQFSAANTGPSTYAPDGLSIKPLYGRALSALQGGEIALNGIGSLVYVVNPTINAGAGAWILMECTGGVLQILSAIQSNQAATLGQLTAIQTNATATYETISAAAATYLPQTTAASTYETISAATATYLSQANAATTYATLASAYGIGQTPTNVTASRAANTTYYNATLKPIDVILEASVVLSTLWTFTLGPLPAISYVNAGSVYGVSGTVSFTVLPGVSYSASGFTNWFETR